MLCVCLRRIPLRTFTSVVFFLLLHSLAYSQALVYFAGDPEEKFGSVSFESISRNYVDLSDPSVRYSSRGAISPYQTVFDFNAISADGSTIVGAQEDARNVDEAHIWTEEFGFESLNLNAKPSSRIFRDSVALDVSGDGGVVVGYVQDREGARAFRWTREGGAVKLGTLEQEGAVDSFAYAVSDDGDVVAGVSFGRTYEAFRWTRQTGMIGLGSLVGTEGFSWAYGISGDGKVVVGKATDGSPRLRWHAFRWTKEEGMHRIVPENDVFTGSRATDASYSGSVVVGIVESTHYRFRKATKAHPNGDVAFRWTKSGGLQLLGRLTNDARYSIANAVSSDGSTVVGTSDYHLGNGRFRPEAFIWTEERGMERLADVLMDAGIDLTDIVIGYATGISGDGERIIGYLQRGEEADSYLAILTPDGLAGLLGLTDFAASVEGISEVGGSAASLALRGAGDMMFVANSFQPDQKPVDVASLEWSGLGNDLSFRAFTLGQGLIGLTEDGEGVSGAIGLMGGSQELGLSAGLALQGQYIEQTGGLNDSHAESHGIGPTASIRYAPGKEGVSLTLTGNYSFLDADTERRYRNGAAIDTAFGNTDGFSFGGEFQAGWRFGFGSDVTAMPYVAYQAQHAQLDAYNETGAPFAGSMSEQDTTIRKAKLGALGAWRVSDAFSLTGGLEFAYVDEDVSHAGLNVAALGAGTFGGTGGNRDYGVATVGLGAAYDVNERIKVFGSIDVTKALSSDADDQDIIGGRLGVSVALF